MLHFVAGQLVDGGLIHTQPFREPHHSASMAAFVGGGPRARTREISLAHNGVLSLDELAEFARPVLIHCVNRWKPERLLWPVPITMSPIQYAYSWWRR